MNPPVYKDQHPHHTILPGQTLQEKLEAIGMSQAELAQRMGRPTKTINGIIKNKVAITPETALQLERVLGIPANFWNNQEQHYREVLARQQEEKHLTAQVAWLNQIPIQAMIAHGWIQAFDNKVQQLREVLQFFGVVSPKQWRALWLVDTFKKSPAFQRKPGVVAAWLRQAERIAQQVSCRPYDAKKFRQTLNDIRPLTLETADIFWPKLVARCAAAGVAVTLVSSLPGIQIRSATRWLTPYKALLQLRAYPQTEDQFWVTFFHGAGHILLHGKREVFLEEDEVCDSKQEEADHFATDMLISPVKFWRFVQTENYDDPAVIQTFAARLGIAPGIVVGRLQRDQRLSEDRHNELKRQLIMT